MTNQTSLVHLNPTTIRAMGLDARRVSVHAQRVRNSLQENTSPTIPILNSCSVANGGVISWKQLQKFTETDWSGLGKAFAESSQKYWSGKHLVTCIPAAGAASRFLGEVRAFVDEVQKEIPSFVEIRDFAAHATTNIKTNSLSASQRKSILTALAKVQVPAKLENLSVSTDSFGDAFAVKVNNLETALTRYLSSSKPLDDLTFQGQITSPDAHAEMSFSESPGNPESDRIMRTHWSRQASPSEGSISNKEKQDSLPRKEQGATVKDKARAKPQSRYTAKGSQFVQNHWMESVLEPEAGQTEGLDESGSGVTSTLQKLLFAFCCSQVLLDEHEGMPKAMAPTTDEGDSFLFLKLVEQMSLIPCRANFVIAPAGQTALFKREIETEGQRLQLEVLNPFETARTPFSPAWMTETSISNDKRGEWHVLEQGDDLSTIRFTQDGKPLIGEKHRYSKVSAGHGELVHLFPEILKAIPDADCLHIRNIDNIIGTSAERRQEIQAPSKLFRIVRDCVETIRKTVHQMQGSGVGKTSLEVFSAEATGALETLSHLLPSSSDKPSAKQANQSHSVTLAEISSIVGNLFHWPRIEDSLTDSEKVDFVYQLLKRPLSVFGAVKKEGSDVGGGPVFAKLPDGDTVKICMEMPHASQEDRDVYFSPKGKVSHFNPVLVFFELKTCLFMQSSNKKGLDVDFSSLFDDRFWLLAKKEFAGQKVCYHETVLYELIGNSATSNLLFVEVPRTLFNPHKTLFESLGQDRRSYGFDETLKTQEER